LIGLTLGCKKRSQYHFKTRFPTWDPLFFIDRGFLSILKLHFISDKKKNVYFLWIGSNRSYIYLWCSQTLCTGENHNFTIQNLIDQMSTYLNNVFKAAHTVLSKKGNVYNGTEIVQTIIQLGKYSSDILGIDVRRIILLILVIKFKQNFERNSFSFKVAMDSNADSEGKICLKTIVCQYSWANKIIYFSIRHIHVTRHG